MSLLILAKYSFYWKVQHYLLLLSALVLISDSLFHLLPEALEQQVSYWSIGLLVSLGGFITFSINAISSAHDKNGLVTANLANEMLHNFIDGLALSVSFMTSVQAGNAALLGIALHEIPQEIGDFVVLKAAGLSTQRLLYLNFLVSLTCPIGVLIGYWIGSVLSSQVMQVLVPITAGSFLAFGYSILKSQLKFNKTDMSFVALTAAILLFLQVNKDHDH